MYLCAKSIPIANKLVSLANGYEQMRVGLIQLAVSYSNFIGREKFTCQNFDEATTLLESGQKLVKGPVFDHFVQSKWSPLKKRRTTAK